MPILILHALVAVISLFQPRRWARLTQTIIRQIAFTHMQLRWIQMCAVDPIDRRAGTGLDITAPNRAGF